MVQFIVSEPTRATCCPTCNRAADNPYRVLYSGLDNGEMKTVIMQGCVDAFHEGHITGRDLDWHYRPEAEKVRKAMAARLRDLGIGIEL